MVIRLLGPVELRTADGETAELAGAQRRAVLALLALRSERVVPIERFFELLWGDEPPPGPERRCRDTSRRCARC